MTLDKLAILLCILAVLFIAWVIPAPFLWWTLAGSAVLMWRFRVTRQAELVMAAVIMPVFCILRAPLCGMITTVTPHTIDVTLAMLDFGLGDQWRVVVSNHPWLHQLLRVAYYDALPFWMLAVMAYAEDAGKLLKCYILAAVAAVPFYLAFPAVGPVWIHTAGAPRNCVPSLHLAWALMAWAASSPHWRLPSAILAVLVGLATVGLGEHYLIDLVVAVPFTWAMWNVPLTVTKIIVDKWQHVSIVSPS